MGLDFAEAKPWSEKVLCQRRRSKMRFSQFCLQHRHAPHPSLRFQPTLIIIPVFSRLDLVLEMDSVTNCDPCLAYEPLSFTDSKSLHQLLVTSRDHENHFPFTLLWDYLVQWHFQDML
jgi:hypothetical protein